MIKERTRKRLALLCARLAALQEESFGANQAAQLMVGHSTPANEQSIGAHGVADVVRVKAGQPIGDYVASAETAGLLPKTLNFLAWELSPSQPNAWGAFLLGSEVAVLIVVTLVFSFFVAPTYQKVFEDLNAPLPRLTLFMFGLLSPSSPFIWIVIFLGIVAIAWRLSPAALARAISPLDRIVLALPEIGKVQRTRNSDVLAGWLGHIGPANHQTIACALRAAVRYGGDHVSARACRRLETSIAQGPSLQETIRHASDFDAQIKATIAATECNPGLDLAAALRARWRASRGISLRWPNRVIIIAQLIIGLFVALVVTTIYIPIFEIASFVY